MPNSTTLSESNLALAALKDIHNVHILDFHIYESILKQKLHTAVLYVTQEHWKQCEHWEIGYECLSSTELCWMLGRLLNNTIIFMKEPQLIEASARALYCTESMGSSQIPSRPTWSPHAFQFPLVLINTGVHCDIIIALLQWVVTSLIRLETFPNPTSTEPSSHQAGEALTIKAWRQWLRGLYSLGAEVEKAVEMIDPRSVSSISVPIEFNKQGKTKKLSQKHYHLWVNI